MLKRRKQRKGTDVLLGGGGGITFEKVRRVTNDSPKMTILSLASDL